MLQNWSLVGRLQHSIETGEVIKLATGYGSRVQELIDEQNIVDDQGLPLALTAPLWSLTPYTLPQDKADRLVRQVHRDAALRADLVTTGTWVTPTALGTPHQQWREAAAPIFNRAVASLQTIVTEARAEGRDVNWIGAFGPFTDSHTFSAEHTPSIEELVEVHRWTAQALKGTEALWGETACHAREARAMAIALRDVCWETGQSWGISLTPHRDGNLRDGTPIEQVVEEFASSHLPPSIIGINCVPPPDALEPLKRLIALRDKKFPNLAVAVYPNGPGHHEVDPENPLKLHWKFDRSDAAMSDFKEHIEKFAAMGANVIGGCCGTTCSCGDLIASVVQRHNTGLIKKRALLVCEEV